MESEAILILKRGLENDPSQWPLRLLLAEIYASANHPDAASYRSRAGLEATDTAMGWYLKSLAILDSETAKHHAIRAVELDRDNALARARLAYLCERTNDLECALEAARELGAEGDVHWNWFEGHVLTRQGRHRDAISRYDSLRDLNVAASLRLQALNHFLMGDHDKAIDTYTEAIRNNPKTDYAWDRYRRATVFWIDGRLEEAAGDYAEMRNMAGFVSHADARLFLVRHDLALNLQASGNAEKALQVLASARQELRFALKGAGSGSVLERILKCLAGEISPEELVVGTDLVNAKLCCELCYYAGEASLLRGDGEHARSWFRKCVETGLRFDPEDIMPNPMNEYHLALWRLQTLEAPLSERGTG
jgi:tetratricopeptide (TPR) repeat protein